MRPSFDPDSPAVATAAGVRAITTSTGPGPGARPGMGARPGRERQFIHVGPLLLQKVHPEHFQHRTHWAPRASNVQNQVHAERPHFLTCCDGPSCWSGSSRRRSDLGPHTGNTGPGGRTGVGWGAHGPSWRGPSTTPHEHGTHREAWGKGCLTFSKRAAFGVFMQVDVLTKRNRSRQFKHTHTHTHHSVYRFSLF